MFVWYNPNTCQSWIYHLLFQIFSPLHYQFTFTSPKWAIPNGHLVWKCLVFFSFFGWANISTVDTLEEPIVSYCPTRSIMHNTSQRVWQHLNSNFISVIKMCTLNESNIRCIFKFFDKEKRKDINSKSHPTNKRLQCVGSFIITMI